VYWRQQIARLETGTFELPAFNEDVEHVSRTPTELSLLLGGIEMASVRRRKRFRQTA
jgi:hypothetical protein